MRDDIRRAMLVLVITWVGFNLRATVLGVPPLLDDIGHDMGLSSTGLGFLTSLPVLCFGVMAIPGAAIVRRIGGHRTVAGGLVLVVLGSLLRSLPIGPDHGVVALFAGTAILGTGIGIAQPAVPRVLRLWAPHRVEQASVVVSLGYIIGQVVAAGIALQILASALGGWRQSLASWAIPATLALALWLPRRSDSGDPATLPRVSFRGLLGSRQMWCVAVMMAASNLAFFTANAWLSASTPGGPGSGAAELDTVVLNAVALPIVLVLSSLKAPFVRSRPFYACGAAAMLVGAVGWMLLSSAGPVWLALLGGGSALAFAGLVAFPATLAEETRVAPFSALIWTIGCVGAFFGPALGGVGIDTLHWNAAPFLAIAIAAGAMLIAAWLLPTSDTPLVVLRRGDPTTAR